MAAATREEGDYSSAALEEDVFEDGEDDEEDDGGPNTAGGARDPFLDGAGPSTSGGVRPRQDSMVTSTTEQKSRTYSASRAGRSRAGQRSTSIFSQAGRPALYQNTGLVRSPLSSPRPRRESQGQVFFDNTASAPPNPQSAPPTSSRLGAIPEHKPSATTRSNAGDLLTVPGQSDLTIRQASINGQEESTGKDPLQHFSILRDLPITLIAQYTILGLHGTICDQLFMSYLVSKTEAGGLGLAASDFAEYVIRIYPTHKLP